MSRFLIFWQTGSGAVTEVEADTIDEALEMSGDLLPGSLCHQCASHIDVGDDWEPSEAYQDDEQIELP